MSSFFITGAGRGLGLELVSQLNALPHSQISMIFGTSRSEKPSTALQKLMDSSDGRIVHVPLQITEKASVEKAAAQVDKALAGKGLDVLINNAGIMPISMKGTEGLEGSDLREALSVNVEAVHNVTAEFLPLLRKGKGKKVANISTTLGSLTRAPDYRLAPAPAYKISKAALNMLTVVWAQDLADEGFTVIAVTPGYLQTDMATNTGQTADFEPSVGAKATLDVVLREGRESNGKFLNIHVPGWEKVEGPDFYDGAEVPW